MKSREEQFVAMLYMNLYGNIKIVLENDTIVLELYARISYN